MSDIFYLKIIFDAKGTCAQSQARLHVDQLDQEEKKCHCLSMAKLINLYDAKSHLSELVERAAGGEEIIIAKAGKPKARLVAIEPKKRPQLSKVMGKNLLGITYIAPDFDDDLPIEFFLDKSEDARSGK
jgi:prevent-host-death family protein